MRFYGNAKTHVFKFGGCWFVKFPQRYNLDRGGPKSRLWIATNWNEAMMLALRFYGMRFPK